MKICWDNLEILRYHKDKKCWYTKNYKQYIYADNCKYCGEPFLSYRYKKKYSEFCNLACLNKSTEHIEAVNKKLIGRKLSEDHKKNIGLGERGEKHHYYGKNRSEKTKQKISRSLKGSKSSNFGKTFSAEHRRKMGEAQIGEKNHQWKGGISCEPYCDVWLDKDYKESIKQRDNYICQNETCYGTSEKLCLHHINYIKKDCHPKNLITLCLSCNTRANMNRDFWSDYYKQKIRCLIKGGV